MGASQQPSLFILEGVSKLKSEKFGFHFAIFCDTFSLVSKLALSKTWCFTIVFLHYDTEV